MSWLRLASCNFTPTTPSPRMVNNDLTRSPRRKADAWDLHRVFGVGGPWKEVWLVSSSCWWRDTSEWKHIYIYVNWITEVKEKENSSDCQWSPVAPTLAALFSHDHSVLCKRQSSEPARVNKGFSTSPKGDVATHHKCRSPALLPNGTSKRIKPRPTRHIHRPRCTSSEPWWLRMIAHVQLPCQDQQVVFTLKHSHSQQNNKILKSRLLICLWLRKCKATVITTSIAKPLQTISAIGSLFEDF